MYIYIYIIYIYYIFTKIIEKSKPALSKRHK